MSMWNIFMGRTVDSGLDLNVIGLRIAESAAARFLAPSIIPFSVPSILPWQIIRIDEAEGIGP